jgi:hypothetical protein
VDSFDVSLTGPVALLADCCAGAVVVGRAADLHRRGGMAEGVKAVVTPRRPGAGRPPWTRLVARRCTLVPPRPPGLGRASFGDLEAWALGHLESERRARPGTVLGRLPRHHVPDDQLADTLTLPRLRSTWGQSRSTTAGRSGAFRVTGAERAEIYRHAARQAAAAAEHLRWCTVHDPGRGADAAWAVADTLHVAARATGSRVLRRAAQGYDRASRAPYGRIPRRTGAGEELRAVARLLAMTGQAGGDVTVLAGALAVNLAALMEAVAALRQAQAHAAQAAAARQAAEQLHAALTGGRVGTPRPGAGHVQRPQPRPGTGRTGAEFPVPVAQVVVTPAVPGSSSSRSQVRQPPARARPAR